jgi:arsenate reductase
MNDKPNVLFLCTGNSCRSQMAEGLLRHMAGERFEVYSAGTEPAANTHPLAIRVMSELGIDISQQEPKGLKPLLGSLPVRHAIIVCDGANQTCPRIWPGVLHRHYWPFYDPAQLTGDDDTVLAGFREVRDQIRERLAAWLQDPDAVVAELAMHGEKL